MERLRSWENLLAMSTLLELEWPLLSAPDWKLPGRPPLRADRSVRGCSRSTGAAAAAASARAAACGDSALGVAGTPGLVRWCGVDTPLKLPRWGPRPKALAPSKAEAAALPWGDSDMAPASSSRAALLPRWGLSSPSASSAPCADSIFTDRLAST